MTNPSAVTFATLDEKEHVVEPAPAGEEYPLPAWYRSVRTIPITDLPVEDLAKACRQQIHVEHVVPVALSTLEGDPVAGSMYEGELVVSLLSIAAEYWAGHPQEASSLRSVIEAARRSGLADLERDLDELERRVSAG